MAFSLLKLTEKHLARKRLPMYRGDHLRPTEASVELEPNLDGSPNVIGTCARATYYRYTSSAPPKEHSSYTHWIFSMGHAVEASLTEHWKQMGIWVDNSVRFYNAEYNISGELDVILRDPEGNNFIVECKSFAGYEATKQIVGNKSRIGAPKDDHLLQILVYLFIHKDLFSYGKLIYLDKTSTSGNAEFDIALVTEGENTYPSINGVIARRFSIEQIFERYKKVSSFIEQKELPPRDYELVYPRDKVERLYTEGEISDTKYKAWQKGKASPGDWRCRYCVYKNTCWDLVEEEENKEEE